MLADPDVPREPFDELKYIQLSKSDARTYLSLGANARERFEVNDAQFGIGGSRPNAYLLSRLEAHSDLRIAGQVQFFFQLQSDEAPGKLNPSPVDQDRLGIEQGFVALSEPIADGAVMIRIGRQEDGFDLQRFLSVRDGPNVRQAYDGATVAYTRGPWRFIALYTDPVQNQNLRAFDDYSTPHLSFGLLRIERKITSSSSLSAYVGRFRQDDARFPSASGNERRDLVDVRYTGSSDGFDWDAEGMGQNGTIGTQSIHAWATGAIIGRTLDSMPLRPRVSLQFDAASGDKNPTDNQLNTFNPLFPSGYYFTTAGYSTYANLVHVKAGLSLAPRDTLHLSVGAGGEWRATVADAIYTLPDIPLPNTAGQGGRYVGAYGQFRADCALTPHVALALEFVHFVAGPTIVSAGGHDADYLGTELRYGW
ncbi:MAG TPA: alginate export family protein [Rhizomicrobium sp.]|jgi:hypothetical protein|nr:alginate export family protein [Rhizomicrobium sp.]